MTTKEFKLPLAGRIISSDKMTDQQMMDAIRVIIGLDLLYMPIDTDSNKNYYPYSGSDAFENCSASEIDF